MIRVRLKPAMLITALFALGLFLVPNGVFAATKNARQPEVKIYNRSATTTRATFSAFAESYRGGATVAVGDVNGDGVGEIIAGAGPGGGPHVRVFKADGTVLTQFFAYEKNYRGGVKVAACDFDNDGIDEILVGTGQGGAPQIRVLTWWGDAKFTPGFYPFARKFRGGVNVACGDVTGDGLADIVVGVGIGADPHVRVFDRYGKPLGIEIYPYADRDRGGVSVAVGNVDGGKEAEIVTAIYRFGRSLVKVYRADAKDTIVGQFEGWSEGVQGGFHVAAGNLDSDPNDEILVALASGGGPQVRAFEAYGKALPQNFFPYESGFRGGVNAAIGDTDGDGADEIVTAPGRNTIVGSAKYQKYIEVRLDEQRLYAYENGLIARTFLISSGIAKYPTPEGAFAVQAKIPIKDYEWSYGPDHPDNYDIKDVKWNLRFTSGYYLHYAFWHNNFGRRMSHGCININLQNSEWIYNWADVGTPVIVKQ